MSRRIERQFWIRELKFTYPLLYGCHVAPQCLILPLRMLNDEMKTWKGFTMRLKILATVLALSATMAYAEGDMMKNMSEGLTMLESSAAEAFKKYGIDADPMALTLNQLAEISGAMTGSNNDADMKAAIEAAIRK
jgi:hypothetical protein